MPASSMAAGSRIGVPVRGGTPPLVPVEVEEAPPPAPLPEVAVVVPSEPCFSLPPEQATRASSRAAGAAEPVRQQGVLRGPCSTKAGSAECRLCMMVSSRD
jgi:hypothetical protein